MRRLLVMALSLAAAVAAAGLEIVRPVISQMDGGTAEPAGFEYTQGEMLYFTCRVSDYARTEEQKIHLTYSVQVFDPRNVAVDAEYRSEHQAELSASDKDWMPKIATSFAIPPMAPTGTYKVLVKVIDVVGKTNKELAVPFKVRGKNVAPSDTVTIRNFQFLRGEDDTQALAKPVYKAGDGVWAKFDMIGFQYGPKNKIDVSYSISVIAPSGKVLWTQPEPAVEKSESYYPKRYVSAAMGITLQSNMRPGEYTIALAVKDAIGGQAYEEKFTFTVE
jgi:hypothetical protein